MASICGAAVLIAGIVLAVIMFGKAKKDEPVILPTDVVAGQDESSANFVKADTTPETEALHTVKFKFYNKPGIVVSTATVTAGKLMDELGIEYKKDKILSVDETSEITADAEIEIKDVEFKEETVEEEIENPFSQTVLLRPDGAKAPFGMELSKESWSQIRAERLTVSLPKEAILPLREKGSL